MGSRGLILLVLASIGAAQTAHFHHVHLNSTDPPAAVRFYTSKFAAEAATFGGAPAVWTQKSWLLFSPVKQAPPHRTDSPVWHIGWGAEDMPAAYQQQLDSGTHFDTPLTDISDLTSVKGFYYAYIDGPDHALIEINTAPHHHFGHLHLFSADPAEAAQWYARVFGVKPRLPRSREPRMYRGVQVGPSASFTIDNVNVILFPAGYRGHQRFTSSLGTVFDHIAFSVDDLDSALKNCSCKILREPNALPGGKGRSAIVEGPDLLAVEIVEGHARQP